MKKILIIICLFFTYLENAWPLPTNIPDSSLVSGTWTLANSPYIIEGEAIIDQNDTLLIEPGVEVRFKTGTNFDFNNTSFDAGFIRVNGTLLANGTAGNMITFTRNGTGGNWGIIYFSYQANDNSYLMYCKVEYGNKVMNIRGSSDYYGAISCDNSNPNISNCIISNNNSRGIHCGNSNPLIISNKIISNGVYGIDCYQSSPHVINNLIADNLSNGIYCYYSYPQITNNTIVNNTNYGIYLSSTYSNIIIKNSIFWGQTSSIYKTSTSYTSPTISYCLIQEVNLPSSVSDAGNNIFGKNPHFTDASNGDYSLQFNSFCIQNGTPSVSGLNLPSVDLNGNNRIFNTTVDIGAYEFQSINSIRMISPNGNEGIIGNTNHNIKWQSSGSNVKLEYSVNGGISWNTIIASTNNTGSFNWQVPLIQSDSCKIRISDVVNSSLVDTCDSDFLIYISNVTDGRNVKGNWSINNSPYIIEGEVIIAYGDTLTIDPGVELKFKTGTNFDYTNSAFDAGCLIVYGTLFANGTSNNLIKFTRDGTGGNWGIVYFSDLSDDNSSMRYCKLEFGNRIENLVGTTDYYGVISCDYTDLEITNSVISNNLTRGIQCYYSSPIINSNKITYCGTNGIYCDHYSNALIINNLIANNSTNGIYCYYYSYPQITSNTIVNNSDYGIYLSSIYTSIIIKNSVF